NQRVVRQAEQQQSRPAQMTQPAPKFGREHKRQNQSHIQRSAGWSRAGRARWLGGRKLCDLHELQRGCWGQGAAFGSVAVEQLQAFQAAWIEVVVNVFREVGVRFIFGESYSTRPLVREEADVLGLHAMIA